MDPRFDELVELSRLLDNLVRLGFARHVRARVVDYVALPGRDTMTQHDVDNGRLVCEIGVAPVKPAEFVISRIQQKTLQSQQ